MPILVGMGRSVMKVSVTAVTEAMRPTTYWARSAPWLMRSGTTPAPAFSREARQVRGPRGEEL